eukprot:PhF_6_TR14888/c1_g3_i2/m.23209
MATLCFLRDDEWYHILLFVSLREIPTLLQLNKIMYNRIIPETSETNSNHTNELWKAYLLRDNPNHIIRITQIVQKYKGPRSFRDLYRHRHTLSVKYELK